MLAPLAIAAALFWIFSKVLDVPVVAKPLQLLGLVTALHLAFKHRDVLASHLRGVAAEARDVLTLPPGVLDSTAERAS